MLYFMETMEEIQYWGTSNMYFWRSMVTQEQILSLEGAQLVCGGFG